MHESRPQPGLATALGGALCLSLGCATQYAYSFHLANSATAPASSAGGREVTEDADLRAELLIDPAGAEAVLCDLTNKTDQVLQVDWAHLAVIHAGGSVTSLRPDVDLGWIQPGAKLAARLTPFVLPRSGSAAAAYEGQQLELDVPVIVRRERRLYRYAFTAHVRKL